MWKSGKRELKELSLRAAPMVGLSSLHCFTQVVVITIARHLGQLPLSAAAVATSITDVTGFTFLIGLCGGLETLCGQANGAKQYQKLGIYTLSSIISLIPICIPIILAWIFMDKLLVLAGQNAMVSHEARNYALLRIPGLIAAAIYYPLARFLQSQSLSYPLLLSALACFVLNTLLCWFLVFKMLLGIQALALSVSLYNCLNMVCIGIYIIFSSSCEKTRAAFTQQVFHGVRPFLRFGFPAAIMVCLKWWTFELVMFLAGHLTNSQLETSVLSICLNMSTLHLAIPTGLGVAASIRVANQLGAGNPKGARLTAWVATFLGISEAVVTSTVLFCCRHIIGYAYSHDKEFLSYVSMMVPFVCLSFITDGLQMVLSGVAKGSGRQHIGAYANVGAFYLVGIPTAIFLSRDLHLRAKGLWIGILVGSIVQSLFFIMIVALTNWQKQADKAKKRAIKSYTDQRMNGITSTCLRT